MEPELAAARIEVETLIQRLQNAADRLQSATEQVRVSNRELDATFREARSVNEDLGGANEQLETLNRQLVVLSEELEASVAAQRRMARHLDGFLSSSDIVALLLNPDLRIAFITPNALDLFDLASTDVGKPLDQFAHVLPDPNVLNDVRAVLADGTTVRREVGMESGAWYDRTVLPHHGDQDRLVGVVVTFVDITGRKQSERRLTAEHAVGQVLAHAKDFADAAPRVLDAFCGALGVEVAELWLPDEEDRILRRAALHAAAGLGDTAAFGEAAAESFSRGLGLPGRVWQDRAPAWITDVRHDPAFLRRSEAAALGLRTGFAFPILLGEACLGVMSFFCRRALPPEPPLLEMMEAVGRDLRQFIQRTRAEALLLTRIRQQAAAAEISRQALGGAALPELMDHAVGVVAEILDVEYCTVLELLPDGQELLLKAGAGWSPDEIGRAKVSAGLGSLGGYTLSVGQPVIVVDYASETRFEVTDLMRRHGVASGISVVIAGRDQQAAYGTLGAHTRRRRDFTQDDALFLQSVADVLAGAIQRKRAETAVAESVQRLRRVLDNLFAFVGLLSPEGIVLEANRAPLEAAGLDFSDVQGRRFEDCYWWSHSPGVQSRLREAIERAARGEAVRYDVDVRIAGERLITLDFMIAPLRDDWGEIIGLIPSGVDISERKRLTEERFQAFLDVAPDALILICPDCTIRFVNEQAERLFGYPRSELVGKPVELLMPQRFRERHSRHQERYFANPNRRLMGREFDIRGRTRDGREVPLEVSISPVNMPEGMLALAAARDITDRIEAEQALRESEERQRFLLRFSDALRTEPNADAVAERAIRMLSEQLQLDRCYMTTYRLEDDRADVTHQAGNDSVPSLPATFRLSDFPEAFRATQNRTLVIEDNSDRQGLSEAEQRDSAALGMRAIVASTLRKGEEKPLWSIVAVSSRPRRWTRDEIALVEEVAERSWAAMERARTEQALRTAKEAADAANTLKSRFVAAASHDLRQPLQTVGLLGGVLAQSVQDEAGERVLGQLADQVASMGDVIDSLLDIDRLDTGQIRPEITRFSVQRLLDRLRSQFGVLAEERGLNLRTVPSSAVVRSDLRLLERLVGNLVSNAIKYTDPGGGVLIGCRRLGGVSLRIEVWDSGVGIPAPQLEMIFDEYHRLPAQGNRVREQGLGLGLAIVKRLGQILGHPIAARSTPGRGSVFAVTVPHDAGSRDESVPSAARPPGIAHPAKVSVMLIEDEVGPRESLRLLLEVNGYDVRAASTAGEAMDLVASISVPPRLIIADYWLSEGMTGVRLIRDLREATGWASAAIVLTGDTSLETRREIEGAGCRYLAKPINPDDLIGVIGQVAREGGSPPEAPSRPAPGSGPEPNKTTVFVVEDNREIREALRSLLQGAGYRIEAFASAEGFLNAVGSEVRQGCVVLDMGLPGMSGLRIQQRLKTDGPNLPVVVISGRRDVSLAVRAMRAGALDFLEKPFDPKRLLEAVAGALADVAPSNETAPPAASAEAAARFECLTPREREVLGLVAEGHANKEVAHRLGLSQRTVENHRARALQKLGIRSLAELVRLAVAAEAGGVPVFAR